MPLLQAAEKILQLRSRVEKILNVPSGYASGFFLCCGLAGGLFEQLVGPKGNNHLPIAHLITLNLFHFFMGRVLSAETAILVTFNPIRIVLLIFHGRIIAPLADCTGH